MKIKKHSVNFIAWVLTFALLLGVMPIAPTFAADIITLTPGNPTAIVNVTLGPNGRVPITVSGGSASVRSQIGFAVAGDPALFDSTGVAVSDDEGGGFGGLDWLYEFSDGELLYAGTINNSPATYTVIADFGSIPIPDLTVSFDSNGGEGIMLPTTVKQGSSYTIPANTFTCEDYTFTGWNTEADGSGTGYAAGGTIPNVTADITLHAQWEVVTYTHTVSFNNNGGTGTMVSVTVNNGENYTIPANTFTHEGYLFTGWNTEADGSGTGYAAGGTIPNVTADITLHAQWEVSTYTHTVSFNNNGGTGTMASVTVNNGESYTIPANTFTRTGYTFTGWNTEADGSGTVYAEDGTIPNVTADITLYAQWTVVTVPELFDITLSVIGGHGTLEITEGTNPAPYGTSVTVTATPDFGYQFKKLTVNGKDYGIAGGLKIESVKEDYNITIEFEPVPTYPTVSSVTVEPAAVMVVVGKARNFTATVVGENNPSNIVIWSVEGGVSGTTINQSGLLTVAKNETATTLTVRATSDFDKTKSGTAVVTVAPQDITPYFTDPAFLAEVRILLNKSDDAPIYAADVAGIGLLDVNNKGIESLAGIEFFEQLRTLVCNNNKLTELDVTANSWLEQLNCINNQLTKLDVSANALLNRFYCTNNKLTKLDVSANGLLYELNCSSNQLTEIDVSNNSLLETFDCSSNQLTEIDVTNNAVLDTLNCTKNQLTSIDVSDNAVLKNLTCHNNQLTKLDLTNNALLETLGFSYNQLTSIDVTKNTVLKNLTCHNNQLTKLDLTNNALLGALAITFNQFTSIDVTNNKVLKLLNCTNNQLTELDLTNNVLLDTLYCQENELTALDLTANTAMKLLQCHENYIPSLADVKGCTIDVISADVDFEAIVYYEPFDRWMVVPWDYYGSYQFYPQKIAADAEIEYRTNGFKAFLNTVTFGLFFKDNLDVTVKGIDVGFGVSEIAYYKAPASLGEVGIDFDSSLVPEWTVVPLDSNNTAAFSVLSAERFILYVRVTDDDGRRSYFSDGIVVYEDSSAVTEKIDHTKLSGDESVEVTLNGNTVADISDGVTALTLDTDYAVDDFTGVITLKSAYLDSLAAGEYTLTVSFNPMGEIYSDGGDNITPSTTTVSLTVKKANQPAPKAPSFESKTETSITLNEIEGAEYRIGNGTWKSSTEFTGLEPNSTYVFYARMGETDIYNASPVSSATVIVTVKDAEGLHISSVNVTENGGWLEITNSTDNAISMKGLFLSDNDDVYKWQMPCVIIRPGMTVRVCANSNNTDKVLKRLLTNFDMKVGETIRLTEATDNVLSEVEITE